MASPDWKVKLSCMGETITFDASAVVSESRSSTWDSYQITHLPTGILSYRQTSARKYGIQAKLVSRNREEASKNSRYLDLIRAWILPDFGGTGATPATCFLSAYANNNIQNLPVVIDQYGWTFPDDVDYVFTGNRPMPVIGMITIEMLEIWSATEITDQRWKMNFDGGGDTSGVFGFLTSTPSFGALGSGFAGIASSMSSVTSALSSTSLGSVSSINSALNSSQLSSSSPSLATNPFISGGGIGGSLSGVPSAPFASPSIPASDGFNRGSFSIDIPVLG